MLSWPHPTDEAAKSPGESSHILEPVLLTTLHTLVWTSSSSGNLLGMQILGSYPTLTEAETAAGRVAQCSRCC